MKHTFLLSTFLAVGMIASAQQLKLNPDNIDEILKAMTLEEKATLLVGKSSQGAVGANANSDDMIGMHSDLVPGAAGTTQAIPRLGIPATVLTDGPAGVRINPTRKNTSDTFYATGFPVGTALACTWNQELVEEVGKAIGNEVLEYGCDVLLAPGMNIHRSPLCGRNFEYYSEDPVVTGKTAAAYVRGVQSQGAGTSIKHFAGNSQESNRTEVDEIISQRALREIYLKGFEIAVKESDPLTVMSSYNRLNGVWTQADYELLTTILRDEWGYKGVVMTDWTGQRNTADQIHAGNDLMEPGMTQQIEEIVAKVKSGELKESDVDICVRRVLQYIVRTPHYKGYKFTNKPDLKAHAQVTRQTATEGMVLLKNNGALPISTDLKASVFGLTSYNFIAGGTGSGDVNKAYTVSLMEGLNNAGLKVDESLAKVYSQYRDYMRACAEATLPASFPEMFRSYAYARYMTEPQIEQSVIDLQAKQSDIALITIGRQAGEGGDRKEAGDFNITETERQMLVNVCNAFHKEGKKVIVILNMGNVLETASWKGLPDAILLAWQPGQEGGNSVADVLTGKANPSGKLTMTWPIALMDVPSSLHFASNNAGSNDPMSFLAPKGPKEGWDYTPHTEGINVGYRYFNTKNIEVSYPFGYGLSYTTFAYSKPVIKSTKEGFEAQITVRNTGKTAGKEVVELYVSAPAGGLEKPAQELKAYAKTKLLAPGESQTLTMKVTDYELASFNEAESQWEAAAGKYAVKFGASVEDIRATATYNLSKAYTQKVNDVLKPSRSQYFGK